MFRECWPCSRPRGRRTGGGFPTSPLRRWGGGGAVPTAWAPSRSRCPVSLSVFKMTEGIKLFIQMRQRRGEKVTAARSRASKPRTLWLPKSPRPRSLRSHLLSTEAQGGGAEGWNTTLCPRSHHPAALRGVPRLYPDPATKRLTPSPGDLL